MRRASGVAFLADLICVVAFSTMGRYSHAEVLSLAGIAETAWPFLTGTVVGWLLSRGWQRPTSLAPTGVVVWISTVVVGLVLRKLTSVGTAGAFIVVATVATAVLLLGWRAVLAAVRRRQSA